MVKGYTDFEQSVKLVKILPITSADMDYPHFVRMGTDTYDETPECIEIGEIDYPYEHPCWSLAALLDILPDVISFNKKDWRNDNFINIHKTAFEDKTTHYSISYGNCYGNNGSWHDLISTKDSINLIDCCVEMILWLKEQNLL